MKYLKSIDPVFKTKGGAILVKGDDGKMYSNNPQEVEEALNKDFNIESFEDFMNCLLVKAMISEAGGVKKLYFFTKEEED